MRLEGKTALITGGGSGFGEGIARRFAEEGANVMLADVNLPAAEKVASEISETFQGAARAVQADVAVSDDVALMIDTTERDLGPIDILVNNAGVTHRNQPMLDVEEEEFDRVYAVNVKSIYLAARKLVPLMRERGGGAILNIASTAGVRPRPGLVWYNGSKGAAITLTRAMAVELAADRIRVNALNPVAGETPLLHMFMGEDTPEKRAQFVSTIPLGRFSQPKDIANAALYLCSDEADFITGVTLEVDGGRCV